MEKILTKQSFPQWVKKLNSYKVYTPIKNNSNNHWNYEMIDINNPTVIDSNYLNTIISPKKIIFPQREIFLEFGSQSEEGYEIQETLPDEQLSVIFGVRPCDARAVPLIDKVFSGEFGDVYYWRRRKSTILVGLACNTPPSQNCFCLSVQGSPFSKEGLDILMVDLEDHYFVDSLTEKGDQLIKLGEEFFTDPKEKDKSAVNRAQDASEKEINRQIKNIKGIPLKLKEMFESSFWDEESLSCIRCGICTYLCPTCHCFDISDEVTSPSPLKGKRVRTWDNCQFPDFTMHSSGHNPRPDKASRLRQRTLHKFQYFVEKYNDFMCTGCSRCVSKCPVGIDIIEVLNKVNHYE